MPNADRLKDKLIDVITSREGIQAAIIALFRDDLIHCTELSGPGRMQDLSGPALRRERLRRELVAENVCAGMSCAENSSPTTFAPGSVAPGGESLHRDRDLKEENFIHVKVH